MPTMSGGVALGGTSAQLEQLRIEMGAGVGIGGAATVTAGGNTQYEASGGVSIGGTAAFQSGVSGAIEMSGGVALGGTSGVLEQLRVAGSGSIGIGGAAGYTPPVLGPYDETMSGGVALGGSLQLREHDTEMHGGVALGGNAPGLIITPFPPMTMDGGVAVAGSATMTSVWGNYPMGGGIGIGGRAQTNIVPPTRGGIAAFISMPELWEDRHGRNSN